MSPPSLPEVLHAMSRLHRQKDASYGDAWRKRGEVLSIFCNIARKYDRLAKELDEGVASAAESLLDTAADLGVYAGKYLTSLADKHPATVHPAAPELEPGACSAQQGPSALDAVFCHLDTGKPHSPGVEEAWGVTRERFADLEAILMTQAKRGVKESLWPRKTQLAWELTAASAQLVHASATARPDHWTRYLQAIEQMERHRG